MGHLVTFQHKLAVTILQLRDSLKCMILSLKEIFLNLALLLCPSVCYVSQTVTEDTIKENTGVEE